MKWAKILNLQSLNEKNIYSTRTKYYFISNFRTVSWFIDIMSEITFQKLKEFVEI